ncbi:hypothetical protein [Streptomyces sp. TLI_105]|uniref:hypothetical protein n=1 Tax=Streptomyces sp. TLI_105 TaxID=1881019 RepID=UPI00089821F6|nr:hypothetical protein [Streptomyces sp. TLI_105]SEE24992.1 hypothetical protein SAMN05428939_7876 [Streptomyces sp. TLI_105]
MTSTDEARSAAAHILGPGAAIETATHPGGSLSLTVTLGDHTVVIDGHPETGWGWSIDPDEASGSAGHDRTADTLDDALHAARTALAA